MRLEFAGRIALYVFIMFLLAFSYYVVDVKRNAKTEGMPLRKQQGLPMAGYWRLVFAVESRGLSSIASRLGVHHLPRTTANHLRYGIASVNVLGQ